MLPRTPLRPISSNIQRNMELSPYIRSITVDQRQAGEHPTDIANAFNILFPTVVYTLSKDASHHESNSLSRAGRPRLLLDRDERLII